MLFIPPTTRSRRNRVVPLRAEVTDLVQGWLELERVAAEASAAEARPCSLDLEGSLRYFPPTTTLEDWVAVDERTTVVGVLRLADVAGSTALRVDELLVHPQYRGRGLGADLVAWALTRAGCRQKTEVHASFTAPLAEVRSQSATERLAAAVGAEVVALGLNQQLVVAGTPLGVDLAAGYELVHWGTVIPDRYACAASVLETSAGRDPLPQCGPGTAELAGCYVRQFETMRVGRARRAHQTGVLDASGALVGFTCLSMTTGEPRVALQAMTVVATAHRGRGLAAALKRANLRRAVAAEPGLETVQTGNDLDNGPMLALNRSLGFEAIDRQVFCRVVLRG